MPYRIPPQFERLELFEPHVRSSNDMMIDTDNSLAPTYAWLGGKFLANSGVVDFHDITLNGVLSVFNGSTSYVDLPYFNGFGDYPCSVVIGFKQASRATVHSLYSASDDSLTGEQHALAIDTNGNILVRSRSQGSSFGSATSTTSIPLNKYAIAGGSWKSGVSRTVYVNGVNENENTISQTVTGINNIDLGRLGDSSPGVSYDGVINFFYYYNHILTDMEHYLIAQDPISVMETA